jgi:acyl-CoA thioesterase YciA
VSEHAELPQAMPVLRVVPMPADANFHGDIFGGWIMSQVDVAGAIPASRRAHGRVATVAVNSFVFREPVLIGDVVSFFATITRTGRTSITVAVEVYAQRNPGKQEIAVKVTEASLTYVAVGADRRPRELPPP